VHDTSIPFAPGLAAAAPRRWLPTMKRADLAILLAMVIWSACFALATAHAEPGERPSSWRDWALMAVLHIPFLAILSFLFFGFVERFDYFRIAQFPHRLGKLPARTPKVCVQLPMFNEDAVAERVIAAACALDWPRDALEIQVLDDSTDAATKQRVRAFCETIAAQTGVDCRWIHRTDRKGYKAGALEEGRKLTDAQYFAIFDADFVPQPDFLTRAVPHFYDITGRSLDDLAVVQAQWGHLNDRDSFLTCAQALWVDDHHTIQKTWRSAMIGFVNFTGTAGVWRARAIEAAGGWRAASLVEDCELSIRALFAGYRTRFVGSIVAPAELPTTIAAYRSQQKRWTQGWAQLQRLHMLTLLTRYPTPFLRRCYLLYFAGISWQWLLWTLWIMTLPFLIASGLWLGALGMEYAVAAYVFPPLFFAMFASVVASSEARATYAVQGRDSWRARIVRMQRVVPYMILNTGMMPHHFCAFLEGMLGPLHAEFVRTPKTASASGQAASNGGASPAKPIARRSKIKDGAYLKFELFFGLTLIAWAAFFIHVGLAFAAFWSLWILACVVGLRAAPVLQALIVKDAAHAR
jgi:cellulose synthase/poly-beta-1,6-N-acetylglucosamine synthase-like glycosyltransferase